MPLSKDTNGWKADDLPWTEEVKSLSKKPLAAGLILAAVLVVGFTAWGLLTHSSNDVYALSDDEAQTQGTGAEGDTTTVQGASNAEGSIFVHVIGAVNEPGVYELKISSRVFDAVEAAGGFSEDASTETLNLARLVTDGEQISIPTNEEIEAQQATENGGDTTQTTGSGSSNMLVNGKVNINTADSTTLQTLSGIGPSTAEKIISDRETNGPFASPEDLKRVSGIGDKKYAAIADSICVG